MCFGGGQPAPPPPPPLAPPPPPPEPPRAPLPAPEPVETIMNPQVRRAKSVKARNPQSTGTGALRIKLNPSLNTGSTNPAGGINKP